MNERELIEGILEQKSDALDALIDDYSNLIYGVTHSVLNLPHEHTYIDECYNDVILLIWYKMHTFNSQKGNLKSWIISITKFKAIDYKRKSNKRYTEDNIEDFPLTTLEDMETSLLNKEQHELLIQAIHRLDETDKQLFLLRYIENVPIKDISQQLGLNEGAIYTRINRGKVRLKKIMEGVYHE